MRLPASVAAAVGLLALPLAASQHPAAAPQTDLDRFMARALERRDIDRQTLGDYVLDEVESFEIFAPGTAPLVRMRREYTWYVRDGFHIRSPLRFDGVPIPDAERKAYEDKWMHSEAGRRKQRTERAEKRAQEGTGPAMNAPSLNEPRFVSESYFMDFKFEPGNYYLAGKETLDGHEVLKIDYLPTKMFDEEGAKESQEPQESKATSDSKATKDSKARDRNQTKASAKETREEAAIGRKMEKTSQVTLWVDPQSHQIVKYTFDNVWLDFLPGGWLVKIDDIRASMQMGQPFPSVWLPRTILIHAGFTTALGSMEARYLREFSNYRKADVTSKVKTPKGPVE